MSKIVQIVLFLCLVALLGVSRADNDNCGYQDSVDRKYYNGICFACPAGCTGTEVNPETNACTCTGCDKQCYVDYDDDDDDDNWNGDNDWDVTTMPGEQSSDAVATTFVGADGGCGGGGGGCGGGGGGP